MLYMAPDCTVTYVNINNNLCLLLILTIHTVSAKMSNYLVPIFDQIRILKLIAESSTRKEICGWVPKFSFNGYSCTYTTYHAHT